MDIDYREEKADIVKVSRNEALYLLSLNTKNRKIDESKVSGYVKEIENGEFIFNGDGIILSKTGALLDGQHRLTALSRTNKTIKVVIVTGIDDDAMKTIDMGTKRKTADILKINGYPNSNNLAAMSNNIILQFGLKRKYAPGFRKINGKRVATNISIVPTTSEILDDIEKNYEEYHKCILFAESIYGSKNSIRLAGLSVSTLSAYYFLFSKTDSQSARSFLREILTGVSERESNVALLIRNKLINNALRRQTITKEKLRDTMITGFNKYVENVSVKSLIAKKGEF